ncbi:MAG: hypothetical protein WC802_04320 [Patescibacteria group bacterium]|jgi:hypothetical protein
MFRIFFLVALSLTGCEHKPATNTVAMPSFSCVTGWQDLSAQTFSDPEPGSVNEIGQYAIYDLWPDGEPLHSYKCALNKGRPVKTMCCDQGMVVTW